MNSVKQKCITEKSATTKKNAKTCAFLYESPSCISRLPKCYRNTNQLFFTCPIIQYVLRFCRSSSISGWFFSQKFGSNSFKSHTYSILHTFCIAGIESFNSLYHWPCHSAIRGQSAWVRNYFFTCVVPNLKNSINTLCCKLSWV